MNMSGTTSRVPTDAAADVVDSRIERIDAIMAKFDEEMTELRQRQRELLKRVLARLDAEKREQIKKELV